MNNRIREKMNFISIN